MATALALDTRRPPMDPDEEAAFLDAIDKWVQKEVRPVVMKHDHGDIWPAELVEQMREMGLFGATIGEEYGGLGLPAVTYAKIVAHIASYWMAITGIFNSHLIMAVAVERFGTPAQKMKWLPKFASGEIRGGLALTEPNAGTDLQAIRTTAVRDGDDYVINGTKTWISNGINGSCFALLVKTDPKADPRYKGMSLMIAPKGPGFSVGRKGNMEILVKQIAGAVAKRIVNYLEVGQKVEQCQEMGFIKFGSRVDLLLPVGITLNVKLNEVVKGGITVIGTL